MTAFLAFSKQIRKQIGSKLTVSYKNGYHFRNQNNNFLRKFYLNMSKLKLEFYPSFTVGGSPPPPPVATFLLILYQVLFTSGPDSKNKLHWNCRAAASIPVRDLQLHLLQLFIVWSNKCKYISTISLDYSQLQDPSTVRNQTELPLYCV